MPAPITPQFVEGECYTRATDVHDLFGGSRQSGIAPSNTSAAVFIFTGEEGQRFGYADFWDEAQSVYHYTGEGQVGHMTFTRGNLAVRNHVADGRCLHLFKKVSRAGGRYEYLGEMQCASFEVAKGRDRNGHARDIIRFQLVRVSSLARWSTYETTGSRPTSIEVLRQRAYDAIKPPGGRRKEAARSVYERSNDVVLYALARASGTCECCGHDAPFLSRDGSPYLEVHHLQRLSDGGLDTPNRVAAICPTCHRRIHYGNDGESINGELTKRIMVREQVAHDSSAQ